MGSTTRCTNPLCSCDPCSCEVCTCGATRLGELERQVMEILWSQAGSEVTGREVADALDGYAYTTVATVLDRLVHKGLVHRRLDSRTIRFSAIGTEATHTAVLMRDALAVSSDRASSLVQFAEYLSPSEAAILRRSLDGLEHETGL